jgi:NAD-dependent deacetylase
MQIDLGFAIFTLKKYAMKKKKIVVLTGAGISAESGLRTFRDTNGLWEGYRIEDVATPRAWKKDLGMVLDFYNIRRAGVREAQPNAAHLALASLEQKYDVQIITQNIDDLHERAGSGKILHLHGEIMKKRSEKSDKPLYPCTGDILPGELAPDGGQFRPHVVWFEEPVPMIEHAVPLMETADIFILIGTSLAVYPAAGLIDFVPDSCPKYVIDKNIPDVTRHSNVICIENSATAGMSELAAILMG